MGWLKNFQECSVFYRMQGRGAYQFPDSVGTKYVGEMNDGKYVIIKLFCVFPTCFTGIFVFYFPMVWILTRLESWWIHSFELIHNSPLFSRFHGEGTLYFPNGAKYKGEWQHGKCIKVDFFFFMFAFGSFLSVFR